MARAAHARDTGDMSSRTVVDPVVDVLSGPMAAGKTTSPVVVVDYDEGWPALFDELSYPVRAAVAGLAVEVEHEGSTPCLASPQSPSIDIDVVVRSPGDVPAAIDRLRRLGYVHQGDGGIPGREAFLWPPGSVRHHLYVVVAGSRAHLDHVAFRDHLRRNSDAAREYGALKRALAGRHGQDRIGYTNAKSDFVAHALRAAGR